MMAVMRPTASEWNVAGITNSNTNMFTSKGHILSGAVAFFVIQSHEVLYRSLKSKFYDLLGLKYDFFVLVISAVSFSNFVESGAVSYAVSAIYLHYI